MRIASGPRSRHAEDRRHDPGDDERRPVSVGQRETADADRDQRCGRDGRVACGPRLRRSPREREHDGEAGDRSRRPPGGGGRPEDREQDGRRDQPPREAEPVDAMVDRGLERRGEDDPEREARDRPDERGDRPDDGAVGQQHEAKVLLRGADGGEHAELAEPSLRDDREACGGDQRGQEQEDGGHGEHRQRSSAGWSFPRSSEPAKADRTRSPRDSKKESTRLVARVDQDRRRGPGAPADEGETSANSSLSLRGFSTMPTTVRRWPSSARVDPISSRSSSATPSVTATSPRPVG